MRRALLLFLPLILACGAFQEIGSSGASDDAATANDESLMSQALRKTQGEAPEPTPPTDREPPPGPVDRSAPADPSADESSPACLGAKEKRKGQEARIYEQRGTVVAAAEAAANEAKTGMKGCIASEECSNDGPKVVALQDRITNAERAYERAHERVVELEATLYEIDKEISRTCGRPIR